MTGSGSLSDCPGADVCLPGSPSHNRHYPFKQKRTMHIKNFTKKKSLPTKNYTYLISNFKKLSQAYAKTLHTYCVSCFTVATIAGNSPPLGRAASRASRVGTDSITTHRCLVLAVTISSLCVYHFGDSTLTLPQGQGTPDSLQPLHS